ncbi:MAG: RNA methyltransferase [Thermodesulfobacteriaceae bacterium]|nr:RNA methyltransferase [Thermodesulfobacteriaceae bacterium]MCX8041552.1 RNA methyltransferase [Thermodesulfobacteriaceae bacterium]MDW8136641.1 RNA methyltransferase [Thermodesulfobacterium sp.]
MQVRPLAEPVKANLSNIAVVLVNPIYSENIGATARACANFGVSNLLVVRPENLEEEKMRAMATKTGLEILERMKVFSDLSTALKDFNYVIGTTARLGKHRMVYYTPKEIAPYIGELSLNNKIALLFGNERTGLSNEDLLYCSSAITIPTTERASLNLSQAVVVILYEIFQSASIPKIPKPQLATQKELEIMFKLIQATLEAIDYIPHDNKVLWMTNIKRLLYKFELTSKEVKIIKGFCRQLLWALGKKVTLFEEEKEPLNDRSEETYQKEQA